ncbi:ATP synthase F1 subunit gamma [candidate division WOR-1 bacterium RIFOXYA12_FULL_52_29]|uniref:ATP synthase F1 subunit gamma n=1 Tax=candidate division WOR-1 bacterium RIFOXYC12_FULL_54_18 TaxID=1802584 RepID=A0A1F4T724_UNCSA|nr:MAG: ATP synthase F1 subunit gamma [candidate division WOR-1 bacterium RIFOXYA2_FULL_51_19]OGC18098.1 MAG: ATP synthase F1 subunit gamma [candidate division WOR-1 bacterium RIFOXYA12_FULL_52_29]OGC26954.1 MAG: ATP synthase F1 subunit gamma [candidate division WOR-1 bacterium RIFOXYB2_FULL_45_9]OGC28515.1 MAG: ATP synthase F1 subunit gamma [candidate division WOR-1 bacterium RIFOXYC12_FULL_54_18]OGC31030.1 MAG: ATP synthase F1 subunit gamma [candidate division WOR-1 bacterium RIFOXYB12_FULL_5
MRAVVQLKNRFDAISKVNKIANAMQIVAIARIGKIRKMEKMAAAYEAALEKIHDRIAEIMVKKKPDDEQKKKAGGSLIVVISSEKGFCGNFNTLLFDRLTRRYKPEEADLVVLGRKAIEFFRGRGYKIVKEFAKVTDQPTWARVSLIYEEMEKLFDERYSEVIVAYNSFKSVISQEPTFYRYLPFERKEIKQETGWFIFEPISPALLASAEKGFRAARLFRIMVENLLGEMGARMIAMRSSTDNSRELMDELNIKLNKARQASITAELSEIAGTIEAMRGGAE